MRYNFLTIFFIAVLAVGVFSGCEKEEVDHYTVENYKNSDCNHYTLSANETRMYITSLPENEQLEYYKALDNEAKADIWKDKLFHVLSLDITDKQHKAIEQLFEMISPEIFDFDNIASINFKQQYSNWFETHYSSFNPQLLGWMIGRMENLDMKWITIYMTAGAIMAIGTQKKCNCSETSDYCGVGTVCKNASCSEEPGDCGTFLLYDCNGRCEIETPPSM